MSTPPGIGYAPARVGASWPGRLSALGGVLIVALPVAMWLANRSAPLLLTLATCACLAASIASEGVHPLLRRCLGAVTSPVGLSLSAFLLWALISLSWSHRPGPGLAMWLELALPLACGLVLAQSRKLRLDGALRRALAFAIIVASVLIVVELASGLSQRTMLGIGKQSGFVFNRPVLTDLVLAAAVLPGFWVARRDMVLSALVVLAVAAAAFVSDSGAAKFGLLVLAVVWLAARFAPRVSWALTVLGFVAIMALAPFAGALTDATLSPAWHQRLAESHSRERVDIWLTFGEAVRARPLLGAGFGASAALDSHPLAVQVSPERREMLAVGHPHSAPLQAWVETGPVGAACLASAGLALLWRLRRLPASAMAPRLALSASAFAVASVAHGAWQGWWIAILALAAAWLWLDGRQALRGDNEQDASDG